MRNVIFQNAVDLDPGITQNCVVLYVIISVLGLSCGKCEDHRGTKNNRVKIYLNISLDYFNDEISLWWVPGKIFTFHIFVAAVYGA